MSLWIVKFNESETIGISSSFCKGNRSKGIGGVGEFTSLVVDGGFSFTEFVV